MMVSSPVCVNQVGNPMYTDPIADMLTRIRNASRVRKEEVMIPFSQMKQAIARILEREGYVATVEKLEETRPQLRIRLKYRGRDPFISGITRISTPGHRKYVGKGELPVVRNNFGIAILSTSRGMMTNKEAREAGVGGEIVCTVF